MIFKLLCYNIGALSFLVGSVLFLHSLLAACPDAGAWFMEVGSVAYTAGTLLDLHAARQAANPRGGRHGAAGRRWGTGTTHFSMTDIHTLSATPIPGACGCTEEKAVVAAAWLYVIGVMPFFVLGSLCFLNRAHTLWGDTADIAGLVLFLIGGVPYSVGAWLDVKVLQWRQQCTDAISPIAAAIPILPAVGVLIWSVGCALDFPGEDIAKTDLAAVMFIVGSILFCISVGISNVLLWMDRYSLSHGTPDQLSWPTQHSETLTDVMRLSDDSVGSPQHQCDGRESSDTQV